MSRELIPMRKNKDCDNGINYPEISNMLVVNCKMLEEENMLLEEDLRVKLKEKEIAILKFESAAQEVNKTKNDYERIKSQHDVDYVHYSQTDDHLKQLSYELEEKQSCFAHYEAEMSRIRDCEEIVYEDFSDCIKDAIKQLMELIELVSTNPNALEDLERLEQTANSEIDDLEKELAEIESKLNRFDNDENNGLEYFEELNEKLKFLRDEFQAEVEEVDTLEYQSI